MFNYIKVVDGVIVSTLQSSKENTDPSLVSTNEYMPQNIGKLYDNGVVSEPPTEV